MKPFVFLLSSLWIFFACQPRPTMQPLLEKANSLLIAHSDSVLSMLDSVVNPEKYAENEYAEWCLLLTLARNNSFREHTSDSLIRIATDYYREHGPSLKYATALYASARVASDMEQNP